MKFLATIYAVKKITNFLLFKTYKSRQIIESGKMIDHIPFYKIRNVFVRDMPAKRASGVRIAQKDANQVVKPTIVDRKSVLSEKGDELASRGFDAEIPGPTMLEFLLIDFNELDV